MLASIMIKGTSGRYINYLQLGELKRGRQAALRRRNRAREADRLQRKLAQELELTCPEAGCCPSHHDKTWSMNDEYQAPSDAVRRALAEDDEGLRFVDFDGAYRTETGR